MEKGKSPTHMLEGGDSRRVVAGMMNGKEALLASMCFVAANSHKGATGRIMMASSSYTSMEEGEEKEQRKG